MKTRALIFGAVIVSLSASSAFADPDAGCGWGTQAWKGSKGVPAKVMAACTNGLFGNQTFGISSGTAGCSGEGVVTASARLSMYAGANLDRLQRDIALGHGESLDTLAQLMGIPSADRPEFNRVARAHFGELFPSDDVTAGQMLTNMSQVLANDPALKKYSL